MKNKYACRHTKLKEKKRTKNHHVFITKKKIRSLLDSKLGVQLFA
jgi:hypothetical protein